MFGKWVKILVDREELTTWQLIETMWECYCIDLKLHEMKLLTCILCLCEENAHNLCRCPFKQKQPVPVNSYHRDFHTGLLLSRCLRLAFQKCRDCPGVAVHLIPLPSLQAAFNASVCMCVWACFPDTPSALCKQLTGNEQNLSCLTFLCRFSLVPGLHPDWMLMLFFAHTHLTVTVTLGLLLIPKVNTPHLQLWFKSLLDCYKIKLSVCVNVWMATEQKH